MRNNFPGLTLCVISTFILAYIAFFVDQYPETETNIGLYVFQWTYIGHFFHVALPSGFLILGFLQLPTYGLLFDSFKSKKERFILLALICVSHFLLIKLILLK